MKHFAHFFLAITLSIAASCSTFDWSGTQFDRFSGIDVSHHQGRINWEQVANDRQNIRFAYVKVTEGSTYHDPMYDENLRHANYAGLDVGAYHFFRMTSSPESQFENFSRHIAYYMDYMTLIPVVDVETFDGKTSEQVKGALEKFVKLMHAKYGVYPIIYGPDIAPERMMSAYVNENCMFFLGQTDVIKPTKPYSIWQYACRGKVNGIKSGVDLDRLHQSLSINDIQWDK